MLYRVVRGMIPHKTKRGMQALERLKVFEGCPPPFDKKKKMVVPHALRVNRLKPGRKYCTIGRLAHENGWKYQDVVATLEEKRKSKGKEYHANKLVSHRGVVVSSCCAVLLGVPCHKAKGALVGSRHGVVRRLACWCVRVLVWLTWP